MVISFLLSLAGSILFALVYSVSGGPQLLGITMALALGSLGFGMGLWAKRLMPHGFTEEREKLEKGAEAEDETLQAFTEGKQSVGRRRLLGGLLGAAAGVLGLSALWPARSLGPPPDVGFGNTGWATGIRLVDEAGAFVRVDTLDFGGELTVFPEGRSPAADDQVTLMRVRPALIRPAPGREAWSPEGYLAYSRVCTHAGCPVGMFHTESHLLMCPCHQATFNILEAGEVVFGPAPRPLPQLPLGVDEEGILVALSDFVEPIGPARWRMD